ncbi:hypothetical protein NQ318_015409 [Aromia moschata]|uniref:Uncharacterized protein n=1 Tax=Aromia moschata TaxID=1265417 RepID=A0AAV8YQN8_9CUCU|nr:hypothetical protein NQ318_015409 [Aromia moschata]
MSVFVTYTGKILFIGLDPTRLIPIVSRAHCIGFSSEDCPKHVSRQPKIFFIGGFFHILEHFLVEQNDLPTQLEKIVDPKKFVNLIQGVPENVGNLLDSDRA